MPNLRDFLFHAEPKVEIYLVDSMVILPTMEAESVDAIVTDPPYGLGFMNSEWDRFAEGLPNAEAWRGRRADTSVSKDGTNNDPPGARFPSGIYGRRNVFKRCRKCGKREFSGSPCKCPEKDWQYEAPGSAPVHLVIYQRWCEEWARYLLRLLKPGAHLLSFGGTRTFHRLTCALEDAGFEIRDCLMWLYGSGFPKSLDVSKAIHKAAGVERERQKSQHRANPSNAIHPTGFGSPEWSPQVNEAITDAAHEWSGWGTSLKPAWEPIVLARKPLSEANMAANVLKHGTGAVNVNGGRIPGMPEPTRFDPAKHNHEGWRYNATGADTAVRAAQISGRWPANLLLNEEAAKMLDEQSGEIKSGTPGDSIIGADRQRNVYGKYGGGIPLTGFGDSGGASRFFYIAKADADDRDGTKHPTVKPVDLCKYLVRLVTPPNGVVLDPFCGSGPIVYAARELGFRVVGIDREEEYVKDTVRRLRQGVLPL